MPFKLTGPHGRVIVARATATRISHALGALVHRFRRVTVTAAPPDAKPKPRPRPRTAPKRATPKAAEFTMYDSTTLDAIPKKAAAVAGYQDGRWPTYRDLEHRWPNAKRLSIAVSANTDADCLDIESGDATPDQAPAWVRRQHARGEKRPVVYASVSQMPAVRAALTAAGIRRAQVREWTAHYTGRPHRCTRRCQPGYTGTADATQYTDRALGRNLDASLCRGDFL